MPSASIRRGSSPTSYSGSAKTARPGLATMLDYVRPGDIVVVSAIDQLGLSVTDSHPHHR